MNNVEPFQPNTQQQQQVVTPVGVSQQPLAPRQPSALGSLLSRFLHRNLYLVLGIGLFAAAWLTGFQHLWNFWLLIGGLVCFGIYARGPTRIYLWVVAAILALGGGLIAGGGSSDKQSKPQQANKATATQLSRRGNISKQARHQGMTKAERGNKAQPTQPAGSGPLSGVLGAALGAALLFGIVLIGVKMIFYNGVKDVVKRSPKGL